MFPLNIIRPIDINGGIGLPFPRSEYSEPPPVCADTEGYWPSCLVYQDSKFYYRDLGLVYPIDAYGNVYPTNALSKSLEIHSALCLTGAIAGLMMVNIKSKSYFDLISSFFYLKRRITYIPNYLSSYMYLKSLDMVGNMKASEYISNPYIGSWVLLRAMNPERTVDLTDLDCLIKQNCENKKLPKLMKVFSQNTYLNSILSLIEENQHPLDKTSFISNTYDYKRQAARRSRKLSEIPIKFYT